MLGINFFAKKVARCHFRAPRPFVSTTTPTRNGIEIRQGDGLSAHLAPLSARSPLLAGSDIWVAFSVGTVFPPGHERVVKSQSCMLSLFFGHKITSGWSAELVVTLFPRMFIPDQHLDVARSVKRCRITGNFPAGKRSRPEPVCSLPTPKRWKRLILPGSVQPRVHLPKFFLALGLVDLRVLDVGDLWLQGEASENFSLVVALAASVALFQMHDGCVPGMTLVPPSMI